MKKLTAMILITVVFALSACQTMKGLGQDIQEAGKAIEKKASE